MNKKKTINLSDRIKVYVRDFVIPIPYQIRGRPFI
jgi:hypothetical protein